MKSLLSLFALGLLSACVIQSAQPELQLIRSWSAKEANQGVAVDAEHFYVIDDKALGKYEKTTGRKVAEWKAPVGSGIIHMNSGIVDGGRLYVAHSNFPTKPDESSVEIFDARTLRHVGRQLFDQPIGSLTWAIPDRDGWLACFAHYRLNSNPALSRLVRYDAKWKAVAMWSFPAELLRRFGNYSSSCGGAAVDGRIWVSGHDARELYRLSLPEGGGVAKWEGTVPFVSAGQAFAWDPTRPQELYSIQRKSREVLISRLAE